MPIGPGYDDSEYDNYDPAWHDQDTPFRQWLYEKLTAAGFSHAHDLAACKAPANRYNGLDDSEMAGITMATGTSIDDVRDAHKADLADWASEQQLRDHPDMALAPRPRSGAAPTNPL
ncbi:hypothetical protein ACUN29_38445 [Streptomyces sp. WC2508]|uniref:hypothetical protein n=1 Tax=Streptomyces sp. WC2508 TaxID=3461405 RepID=UPI004043B192